MKCEIYLFANRTQTSAKYRIPSLTRVSFAPNHPKHTNTESTRVRDPFTQEMGSDATFWHQSNTYDATATIGGINLELTPPLGLGICITTMESKHRPELTIWEGETAKETGQYQAGNAGNKRR